MPQDKWAQYEDKSAAGAGADKWAQYAEASPVTAGPSVVASQKSAGAPQLPKPSVEMSSVRTLTGTPYHPGRYERAAVDQIGGAVQTAADLSAPVIAHRVLQRTGAVSPKTRLYPEEGTLKDTLSSAVTVLPGMVEGLEAEGGAPAIAQARRPQVTEPPPSDLTPKQQAKYTSDIDKANAEHAEALRDYKQKIAKAYEQKYGRKPGAAGEFQSAPEHERLAAKKETLNRGAETYTKAAHDNLQETYTRGRASLDRRWKGFRKQMQGSELDASETFNMIEQAKAKYLKGSPSSLKEFNNLAREMGIQEFMEGEGGELKAIPGTGKLPFDTARVHYSAVADRLASGNLPGNVYKALEAVKQGLNTQLEGAAETRGLGDAYRALKADEHQFRTDWVDKDSPLAKARAAKDWNYLRPEITGKGGDQILRRLAKYREYGARPHTVAAARRMFGEARAIKVPTEAGDVKLPKYPELKEVKRPAPKEPTAVKPGRYGRAAGRIAGKLIGSAAGSAVGHPFIGYAAGGEVGSDIADRLAARRAARRAITPPPPSQ